MGLRRYHTYNRSDPFEPDPVSTGVGKGMDARQNKRSTFKRPKPDLKQQ
jgi:hypothetical protein